MSKTRIAHKAPIIVGFFILLYARITMLQLKNNFLSSFCDTNKYELIKWIMSLYLAGSEEKFDEFS